jgi:hypothetical protein
LAIRFSSAIFRVRREGGSDYYRTTAIKSGGGCLFAFFFNTSGLVGKSDILTASQCPGG